MSWVAGGPQPLIPGRDPLFCCEHDIQARASYHSRRSASRVATDADSIVDMKHTLYENPVTHKFALIRLPETFADGDSIPLHPTDRWFDTREEAVAALPDLLNQDERSIE